MKKQLLLLFFGVFSFLIACNKTDDGVFVRIQNSTADNFKEVILYNKSFKNVNASEVTSYQLYESIYDTPGATLVTNSNDTIYAGYTYFDALFNLADGRYTLKIFNDTTLPSHYNCIYIKN